LLPPAVGGSIGALFDFRALPMYGFTPLDLFAVFFFTVTWAGYGAVMEWSARMGADRGDARRAHRHGRAPVRSRGALGDRRV